MFVLATVCKVISRISRAVISGLLVGFNDFQRIHRFGSKIAERFVDFPKKAHFSGAVFFLLCFVDFKRPIHDYPSKALFTD